MTGHVYQVVSECFVIIEIALIAHYVFLEPGWNKKQYYVNAVFFLLLILAEVFIHSESRVIFSLLFAGLNLSLARKKHRIRGFFLVFPVMGICMGLVMPILLLPEIFFPVQTGWCDTLADGITIILLFLFVWKGKNWRREFEMELQYRKLQKWESWLLFLVGLLLLGLIIPLEDEAVLENMNGEMRTYGALCTIIGMVLTATVVVLVMQGNKRSYYENAAALNESYLNAEVKHFQAYQRTQTETRRIRHDMRNHVQAMLYLAEEGKNEELKQYLKDLNGSVEQIDMELHCGNTLADAICNEKNQIAMQKGIAFTIDGKMPEDAGIESVDLCTIFANALDNALEALEDQKIQTRRIRLEISSQGELLFLRFTNPVRMTDKMKAERRTSKTDSVNHGFGLQNIRLAAQKYNGNIHTEIISGEKENIFSLEIMLFTTKNNPLTT